jgi:hypothetical protein
MVEHGTELLEASKAEANYSGQQQVSCGRN